MNDRCDAVEEAAQRRRACLVWSLPLGAPNAQTGLQRWLYDALRRAIVAGHVPADSVLPGTRTMARQYGLARGTVASAYEQLLSEGYLVARKGSGTRVSSTLPDHKYSAGSLAPSPAAPLENVPTFDRRAARTREAPWIKRLSEADSPFPLFAPNVMPQPFAPHRGDIRLFPIDLWRRLHTRHLRSSRLLTLNETSPGGLPALRSAIAAHLALVRGVHVPPEQIVVVGSVQQALDLCLRLWLEPGDSVWMEDPGYVGARQILHASGARVIDLPVDDAGLLVEEGIRLAPQAALAYVTPSRHAPLGVTMSVARRKALLDWAIGQDAIIFEDDYDSEYAFRSGPLPALRSLPGAASHVVLAGTFSKLMFPSLRLAYVVPPPRLVEPFVRGVSITARSANGLTQAVLADFLGEGHFDRFIRRSRKIYAARAHAFEHAAGRHWRDLIDVSPPHAGLDVVGRLLAHDERTAVRRLTRAGIESAPLGKYTQRHGHHDALVMGFAPFNEEETERAAQRVAAALHKEE